MLTQERLKELLDYDPETGVFVWKVCAAKNIKAGSVAGCKILDGYIKIRINGNLYRAHRLAWLYIYGCWPTNQIDHINRVRDDNRLCNLREATNQENSWNTNKRKDNTSGYRGVCWDKRTKKWQANIAINGNKKHIGHFDTPETAHAAYLAAKEEHHKF